MKPLTILVDVDDVLENLCEEWVRRLNEKYGTSVSYEDVTEWDIAKFYPSLAREQVFAPLHEPDIWFSLSPKEGAICYLKKLVEDGFDVYLCTSTYYKNVDWKYRGVVKRYFPFINWDHVIVTSRKQMIIADFLIDDAPHNLEGGVYIKILMTAPHNKNYDVNGKGIIRCDSWKEIYEVITNYKKLQDKKPHSAYDFETKIDNVFHDAERSVTEAIQNH